jgi:hypothetical protein
VCGIDIGFARQRRRATIRPATRSDRLVTSRTQGAVAAGGIIYLGLRDHKNARRPPVTHRPMKHALLVLVILVACGGDDVPEPAQPAGPVEQYGFVTRLGRDTIAVESVSRRGNTVTSDAVDRFPRVRQRHTEITLGPDGGIRRLAMDIRTPSEPANQRERQVIAEVTGDKVRISRRDSTGTATSEFATGGGIAMAHVPQMYSLYELYFAAALARANASHLDTARLRQFYIDREFDRFPLHSGLVKRLTNGRAEISHDWLSGTGEATLDSSRRLLTYSGARTTYDVRVERVSALPDVRGIGARFAATEAGSGGAKQLSVRDTARTVIGGASFSIDYGRPLARGRQLVGNIIPYDFVWRTGANAATQLTTSAAITLGGLAVPQGSYTLWTVPRRNGTVELIVNKQVGQWGTSYDRRQDLGRMPMTADSLGTPIEQFTISIDSVGARRGTLAMQWGPFRWTAPVVVPAH